MLEFTMPGLLPYLAPPGDSGYKYEYDKYECDKYEYEKYDRQGQRAEGEPAGYRQSLQARPARGDPHRSCE